MQDVHQDLGQTSAPMSVPVEPGLQLSSEALEELVREHQALLAFVNAAPVGVVQINTDGGVQMINAYSAMMLMPISRDGMLDNLYELLADRLPVLEQNIAAYKFAHGLVCDHLRLELPAPAGQRKVAALRVIKMDLERVMVVITDVTDQVMAEQATLAAKEAEHKMRELDAENRRLLEVSHLKNQFVGNLSHELRTPLTSILGYADLLASGRVAAEAPRHKEALRLIGKQGRLLLQLINDLLDMSAMQSDKFEFHVGACDPAALVQDVVETLHDHAEQQGVVVRVQSQLELQPCELDAKRFKQVVYNLLSNAIKFTPADGQVTVAISVDHGSLILLVTDTGIGIAPEHLSDIFLDFHQLDGSRTRHFEGTGLGLALTRRLVQAQGGDVQVSSVLAQGSEFKVSLPMQQARHEGA